MDSPPDPTPPPPPVPNQASNGDLRILDLQRLYTQPSKCLTDMYLGNPGNTGRTHCADRICYPRAPKCPGSGLSAVANLSGICACSRTKLVKVASAWYICCSNGRLAGDPAAKFRQCPLPFPEPWIIGTVCTVQMKSCRLETGMGAITIAEDSSRSRPRARWNVL